ncbi:MAG: glycerophosphodiester phosphodiesterase [Anaerolineaceae bacterium]|nr:MAG: glycerophosphodiester phosphodiesterase [Anaerolineaceae bacterium]
MSLLDTIKEQRTLVFGHRGASAYAPMNTIPAFERAYEMGAEGIEFDVHRSKDGHLVCVHDFTVDSSTDGTGRVKEMTLAEIKSLDAGSWKDEAFVGVRVPTLSEVFEAVGDKLLLNVEIKSETILSDGVEELIADCIRRHNIGHRVLVSSFNPLAIRRFRRYMSDVPIGYLTADDMPKRIKLFALGMRYDAFHPHESSITQRMMDDMNARGITVNTWTVNDPARARELAAMGVSVIITDKPDVIRDALDS